MRTMSNTLAGEGAEHVKGAAPCRWIMPVVEFGPGTALIPTLCDKMPADSTHANGPIPEHPYTS